MTKKNKRTKAERFSISMHNPSIAMLMMRNVEEAAGEEYVIAGMMKIIRQAQASDSPKVAALGNDYARFIEDVLAGRERVIQIALTMR